MAKKKDKIQFIPIYIVFASILAVSIFVTNNQDTRIKAASLDEEFRNCITPPKCCYDIVNTHNAFSCPTPWGVDGDGRGWCPPNICAAIEGKGQRCGWYWLFHDPETKSPTGYGCMIGDSEASMKMKFNSDGTIISYPSAAIPTVQPTNPPVVVPTDIPTEIPTEYIPPPTEIPIEEPTEIIRPTSPALPTQIIRIRPQITNPPIIRYPTVLPAITLVPTKSPFQISLPNILPPKEKIDSIILKIKLNLQDFFSQILP